MSLRREPSFARQLKTFEGRIKELTEHKMERLVLIIMSNTHDPILSAGCTKDAEAVKNTFQAICTNAGYIFCCIEISGKNYSRENLLKAIDVMGLYNDVAVFYYSGHGFSYQKDSKSKYPQVDMRNYSDHADFNKIDFIEKHTENLAVLLNLMRFKGGRVNIAIADCCNTTIPFIRKKYSIKEMNVADGILPPVSKSLTKNLFTDFNNGICILVSSSVQGQPAITDDSIGSIFTLRLTETIKAVLSKENKSSNYLPWLKVLKTASAKAFKDSKSYDIGNGVAGKQKAVFEVFVDRE